MKRPIIYTVDINDIPWYMWDNELYTIDTVEFTEDAPDMLGPNTHYFVYLNN